MLRWNALAALGLGLLAACGSSEPEPGGPRAGRALALVGVGTEVRPGVVLDSTSVEFGEQQVGLPSLSYPLRVTNTGTSTLHVSGMDIFDTASFTVSPNTAFDVPPGESRVLGVTFHPTAEGAVQSTLLLHTNDWQQQIVGVALAGTGVDPRLTLSPEALAFGEQRVGTSATRTVTVRNTGTGTARIIGMPLSPDAPFAVSPGTAFELRPEEGRELQVTFSPTAEGATTATLHLLLYRRGESAASLALSGRGLAPVAALSLPGHPGQGALDFGPIRVGTRRVETVRLTNKGSAPLTCKPPTVSGGSPFISSGPGTLTLPPGAFTDFQVTFAPTQGGAFQGTLVLESDALNSPSLLGLRGEGVDGQPSLTPAVLSFSGVAVGGGGARQAVVLTNTGRGALTLTKVIAPGAAAFSVSGLEPGLVLQPGAQWPFTVTFEPSQRGHVSSTLTLESDAQTSPPLQLAMSGTGLAPAVALLPQELQFGRSNVGEGSTQPLFIQNVGERDLYVSHLSFADGTADSSGAARDFQTDAVFPLVVKPGESARVALRFIPRAVGLRAARALVYTNDRTVEASLLGQGLLTALDLRPAPLDFGVVRVGRGPRELALTLTNQSSESIILAAPEVVAETGEPFSYNKELLAGRALAPGASLSLPVSYGPSAQGLSETTLSFGTLTPPRSRVMDVQLRGKAVTHLLSVNTESLDFGQVEQGRQAQPRVVTVSNLSSEPQRVVVRLKHPDTRGFELETPALTEPLPAGASATFTVGFRPEGTGSLATEVQVGLQGDSTLEARIPVVGVSLASKEDGGGCASSGAGGSGLMALLALVELGVRRREPPAAPGAPGRRGPGPGPSCG